MFFPIFPNKVLKHNEQNEEFQLVSLIAIRANTLFAANAIGKHYCFWMQLERNINMISMREFLISNELFTQKFGGEHFIFPLILLKF